VGVDDGVGVEELAGGSGRVHGDHCTRVALDVAELGPVVQVPGDEVVAVQPDPDHADLW
jgi:hypothetical protein